MERIQKAQILNDLEKKIVLLVGPRQAGKTWLAKNIATQFKNSLYLNYDQVSDRQIIKKQSWLDNTDLLILDELHKMPDWKNYLKGLFDTKPSTMRLLVTGSARLDVYDKLGDSLAGRYFRHRLFPFSLAELKKSDNESDIEHLMLRSGFPEPLLAQDQTQADRWRMQYVNSLLSTDIFEFDKVQNLKAMHLIFDLLRSRVGSTISYQSLSEDVGVSAATVKKYIEILEALFIIFRITPFSKNIARSILKEPKIYFFDTALVDGDDGAKLENFCAFSLIKHVYAMVDYEAKPYKLHYLRTKEGKEVDFALVKDKQMECMIGIKTSNNKISSPLRYFSTKYDIPAIQLVQNLRAEHQIQGIQLLNASNYLSQLYL